jgi:RimJ/RimL family protein N-acetyltransferase
MGTIPDVEFVLPQGDVCVIRVARESDAHSLVEYLNRIGGETPFLPSGAGEFHLSAEEEKNFIARMSAANNSLYLVAEARKRIVGILTLEGNARPRMKHVAELGVSVMKDYWRQGIGRLLMETALGWAESSPVLHKVFLIVHHENQRAIELYLKLGFVQEGVQSKLLYVAGRYHDCLYMARAV